MLKYYIKMALLKEGGPQIRLCLFMIRPITLKQLNSLTSIDTFCWLGGIKVTLQTAEQEVLGSIPCSGTTIYVCFLVLLLLWFYFMSKNTLQFVYLHGLLQFLLQS